MKTYKFRNVSLARLDYTQTIAYIYITHVPFGKISFFSRIPLQYTKLSFSIKCGVVLPRFFISSIHPPTYFPILPHVYIRLHSKNGHQP